MSTYTAHFFTLADWAEATIDARTPKLALKRARRLEAEETETLAFQSYDTTDGVEHIEIWSTDRQTVAEWHSDDRRLRLAANDLLEALATQTTAAQSVIDCWEKGDLASAVRELDASISPARAAIAKATGGAA